MANKNKPIIQNQGKVKWKITEKGSEEPIVFNGTIMTFRTRFAMYEMFKKLNHCNALEWKRI